jgi:hypothetical protein
MLDKEKLCEFLIKSIKEGENFSTHDFVSTLRYVFLNIDKGDFDVKETCISSDLKRELIEDISELNIYIDDIHKRLSLLEKQIKKVERDNQIDVGELIPNKIREIEKQINNNYCQIQGIFLREESVKKEIKEHWADKQICKLCNSIVEENKCNCKKQITDTERLDFVHNKGIDFSRDHDQIIAIFGCITVGKGKSIREAIDAAMRAKDGK